MNKIINKKFIYLNKKAKFKLLKTNGNYRKSLKNKVQNLKIHNINSKAKKETQRQFGVARQNWTFF